MIELIRCLLSSWFGKPSFELGRHLASRQRPSFEVERSIARKLAAGLRTNRSEMVSKTAASELFGDIRSLTLARFGSGSV